MHEFLIQLRREISGTWRFRWWALATAWLVCAVGWIIVFSLSDTYEAQAKFYVETFSRLDRVMDSVNIRDDTDRQVNLVRQVMLGRPMLEQVAIKTELYLRAGDDAAKQMLIDALQAKISLVGNNSPRNPSRGIYDIAYSDVDRNMAIAVVDTLLTSFIEDVIRGEQAGSEETIDFLSSELKKYQSQLREREQALANFKREHVGLLPGAATGGYFDRLQREMDAVKTLESQYRTANSRKTALEEQLEGKNPYLTGVNSMTRLGIDEPRTDIERRIVDLESQLDTLLLRYTDRHPDVVSAREQLDQLYKRRQQELTRVGDDGGLAVNADNPVYQQLHIYINEVEVELAGLESQIRQQRTTIAELKSKIDEIPQIEAQLADLTRDYDQVQGTYDDLRGLLEQENLSLRQKEWDVINFRLIDPPFAALEPTSPQREILLLMALVAGIGAGIGAAWLIHLLKPVIFDARKLQEIIGYPVLGAVSMTWEDRNIARRRAELGSFLAVSASLFVTFGVVILTRSPAGELVRSLIGWF